MSAESSEDNKMVRKMRKNLAALSFGDITGFKTVVSVCLTVNKKCDFSLKHSIHTTQ